MVNVNVEKLLNEIKDLAQKYEARHFAMDNIEINRWKSWINPISYQEAYSLMPLNKWANYVFINNELNREKFGLVDKNSLFWVFWADWSVHVYDLYDNVTEINFDKPIDMISPLKSDVINLMIFFIK